MKKSKIFLALGTIVLATTAIFATKANKKFTSVTTAVWASSAGNIDIHVPSNIFTTNSAGKVVYVGIGTVSSGTAFLTATSAAMKTVGLVKHIYYY